MTKFYLVYTEDSGGEVITAKHSTLKAAREDARGMATTPGQSVYVLEAVEAHTLRQQIEVTELEP